MNIPEKILSTLTDEQKKKVEAAQSPKDLLDLAKETGYELSQEQLDAVAGGLQSWSGDDCPTQCYNDCGIVACIL